MAITANKKFWTEFINIYHSLPSLWNTKDESYNNRECRNAAWNKLVKKLQEVEPDANQDLVKRKINTFRSNFNREVRKISQTQREQGVDIYNPTLWYFNHLSFLLKQEKYNVFIDEHYEENTTLMGHTTTKCQDLQQKSSTNEFINQEQFFGSPNNNDCEKHESTKFNTLPIKIVKIERPILAQEQETLSQYTTLTNIDNVMETEVTLSSSKEINTHPYISTDANNETNPLLHNEIYGELEKPTARKTIGSNLNKKEKLRLKSQGHIKNPYSNYIKPLDEASIYGQSWACGFRKLTPEQKLFAKKAIDEILILGQLNALKLQTVPMNTTLLERDRVGGEQDWNKSLNKNCWLQQEL